MRLFNGVVLAAVLASGPAMAGVVNLNFNAHNHIEHVHFDGQQWSSSYMEMANASATGTLQIPTGPLTHEGLYVDDSAHALITFGQSTFQNLSPDVVGVPFSMLLRSFLPWSFSNSNVYAELGATNSFVDFSADAEAQGYVDHAANYISFRLSQVEVIGQTVNESSVDTLYMVQSFVFSLDLGNPPSSHDDVVSRTAEDVRALLAGLNEQSGPFTSSVSVQNIRCENGSCMSLAEDAWSVRGWVSANADEPVDVPAPGSLLLLSIGLPLLMRRYRR